MSHTANIVPNVLTILFIGALFIFLLFRSLKKSEDPVRLIVKWVVTVLLIVVGISVMVRFPAPYWPPIAAVFAVFVGVIWAPSIGAMVARPFSNLFTGGDEQPDPVPLYSIAESKRKQGHFDEAIRLIRAELEKFPGDFTGMMLIATIQAEDLKDVQAAHYTIDQIAADENRPAQAVATALHALADWYLRLEDPDSARAALERIVQRYPDTQAANMASQRLAHVGTPDQLAAMHQRGPIALKQGAKNIGLRTDIKPVAETDPGEIAAGYVRQLEQHPLDFETREKLVMVYLDHYQRPDLAIDQVEQLVAQPGQPPRRVAHWLNLLATVHVRRNDLAAAEATVRSIIEKFPGTAQAEAAQSRLMSLQGEIKGNQSSSALKLGAYERDLGLKRAKDGAAENPEIPPGQS